MAQFAEWTNTEPPARVIADGTFTDDFLRYANQTGLSLDWVYLGSVESLVMQAHNRAVGG